MEGEEGKEGEGRRKMRVRREVEGRGGFCSTFCLLLKK